MPFEKGNKLGGRNKGSVNKTTTKIRNAFAELLEDNLPKLKDDLEQLDPAQRVRLLIDLSKYVIPQLKATEHKLDDETAAVFNMPIKEFFGVK
jgi:hypothetical protein